MRLAASCYETITLDPHNQNGSVSYGLDPVGNRLSQSSTLPAISTGTFSYDANDRLSTETYDNNGNTTVAGARTFTYDFENHIKSMNNGTVTLQHDGDGNRVAKTVGGTTTRYLVDNLFFTREKGRTPVRPEISKSLCRPAETHIRKGRSLCSTTSAKPEAQFENGLHSSASPKAVSP